MRLDPESLKVQSFATVSAAVGDSAYDTGKGGPDSLCWVCYETGNYVPSCKGYQCEPDTGPDGPPSICWICYDTQSPNPTCDPFRCVAYG
jgi:hypothetical protein